MKRRLGVGVLGALLLVGLARASVSESTFGRGLLGVAFDDEPGKLQVQRHYAVSTSYQATVQQTTDSRLSWGAYGDLPLGPYLSLGLAAWLDSQSTQVKYVVNDPVSSTLVRKYDYRTRELSGDLSLDTRAFSDRAWHREAGANPEGLPCLPTLDIGVTGDHTDTTYSIKQMTGAWADHFSGTAREDSTSVGFGLLLPLSGRFSLGYGELYRSSDEWASDLNGVIAQGQSSRFAFINRGIDLHFFYDFLAGQPGRAWFPRLGPKGQMRVILGLRSANDLNAATYSLSAATALSDNLAFQGFLSLSDLSVPPNSDYDKQDWSHIQFGLSLQYAFGSTQLPE